MKRQILKRGDITMKRQILKRIAVFMLTPIIMISSIPVSALKVMAAELPKPAPAPAEIETEDFEYRTISSSPEKGSRALITLDGLMPSDASVSVRSNDTDSEDTLCSYDISILDGSGEEFRPIENEPITVSITNPSIKRAAAQNKKLRLWHIDDSGLREEISGVRVSGDSIQFETPSFSIFEVDNGIPPLRTYYYEIPDDPFDNTDYHAYYFPTNSRDGSGHYKMICQQTIKDGEHPMFPQLPADMSSRYTFVGWFVYDNGTLSEQPYDFDNVPAVTQTEQITLRAVFKSCVFAIFHDDYNSRSQKFPVIATRRGDLTGGTQTDVYGDIVTESAEINISDLSVTYDEEAQELGEPLQMIFKGWTVVPAQYQTQEEIKEYTESTHAQVIETDTIRISRLTRLYPVFEPIRWLEFNTSQDGEGNDANHYAGATYKPPIYFSDDDGFSFDGRTPPLLSGYLFDGWFTGDGVRVTTADLQLVAGLSTDSLEVRNSKLFFKDPDDAPRTVQADLYAHWIPDMSKYTVVIWKQGEYDAVDAPADERTWDFEESFEFEALTGSQVSVAQQYKSYHFTGFTFDYADEAKAVRGDGKTILNVYYRRNVHTFTFKNGSTVIHSVQAYYGSDISGIWHFTGSDGYTYPRTDVNTNTSWTPSGSSHFTARITQMFVMPDEDITFTYTTSSNTDRIFHYYVEALPEDAGSRSYSGRQLLPYNENMETVEHDFNRIYYNDDFFELEGFSRLAIATAQDNDVTAAIQNAGISGINWNNSWNSELYFYYTRNVYSAVFMDSLHYEQIGDTRSVLFEQQLEGFIPEPTAPEGYEFTGWYADEACSVPVAFTESEAEAYRAGGRNFQDYVRMPAHNIIVYAGWQTQWFKIEIDPNGGVLTGSQATWFWEPYNGDPIEEYKTATRNFEPDLNGEYYYALRNRAYYNLGEEWDPAEDTTYKNQVIDGRCTRGAFYTTDISLASGPERYKATDGAYRYLGWYEVDPVTHEEKPFNFGTHVMKNTYLRLHWKQLGTYFISYRAGEGTVDTQDSNESVFEFLDGDDYADHADIVITRVAIAPPGMNFIGWKIRNDPSDSIYYPGQSFRFSSELSTYTSQVDEQGNIVTKRMFILDAIYREIENAKIIYDANGGSVDSRALTHGGGQDNTRPPQIYTDGTDHPLTPEYRIEGDRLIVSDLMNNSAVRLADGIGFVDPGYELIGWSTTPTGENGTFYRKDSIKCYADTEEPLVLYAQWEFRVSFDKNNANAPDDEIGWGGDWTESGYFWSAAQDRYFIPHRLGTAAAQPGYIPVSQDPDEMFMYWSLEKQQLPGMYVEPFDFDTPITEELVSEYGRTVAGSGGVPEWQLTLYGCWDAPIEIPVHIVDTSDQPWEKHDEWLRGGVSCITLDNAPVSLATAADAESYADPSKITGKTFAFACTAGSGVDDYLNITDADAIEEIKYDAVDRDIKVRLASDGEWHHFDVTNDVYLVYYSQQRTVPISYKKCLTDGTLDTVTPLNGSAPTQAEITASEYAMGDSVTAPLAWASGASYSPNHYTYAIGDVNGSTPAALHIITEYSMTDDSRPDLMLKNTWQGIEYSLDGVEWQGCGNDIGLYVIYYEESPMILHLTEKTIALPEYMSDEFGYSVTIKNKETRSVTRTYYYLRNNNYTAITGGSYQTTVTDSETENILSEQTVTLSDGQLESFVLLCCEPYTLPASGYQRYGNNTYRFGGQYYPVYYREVTAQQIVQTIDIVQSPAAGYVTANDAETGDHRYVSAYTSQITPEPVMITYTNTRLHEKQIHIAVAKNGVITRLDSLRTDDEAIYSHIFGGSWDLSAIDPAALISDHEGRYCFTHIIAGTEDGSIVTPAPRSDEIETLSFGAVGSSGYGFYLNGDPSDRLGGDEIYFVYVERPTIKYMLKSPRTGELIPIESFERNGAPFTRDGNAITQEEILPVSGDGELLISQISTPSRPAYLIPDLLDYHGKYTNIDLSQIAVRDADGSLTSYNREAVSLSVTNDTLQYYFDETGTRYSFSDELTVYAVYQIRGYSLTLRKDVVGNSSGAPPDYRFTIRSADLKDGDYYIGGYGDMEKITAVGHEIELTIGDGDVVTLYGLSRGDYVISEETVGGFVMTAYVDGYDAVVNEHTVAVHIAQDTDIRVVNVYPVPVTGLSGLDRPYLPILTIIILPALLCLLLKRKEKAVNNKTKIKSKSIFITERIDIMKTKTIKKAFALLTTLTTALAMTAAQVSAYDSPTRDSSPAHRLPTSSVTADIPIKKDIVLFNSERKRVFSPNIVYQYSIASANVSSASISTVDPDNNTVVLAVRPGIIEAITAITDSGDNTSTMVTDGAIRKGTITFGADNTNMRATNKLTDTPYMVNNDYKFTKQMDLRVDASKIYDINGDGVPDSEPGVYRYKITDMTTDAAYAASGVTEGSAGDTIFLDVYVKYNNDQTGLVIYGYVLLRSTTYEDDVSINYDENSDEELKIDGYDTPSEGDDNGDGKAIPANFKGDIYITYNVDIKKEVSGDLADRQHKFPFRIQLSNSTVTSIDDFSINNGAIHSRTNLNADGSWDSDDINIEGISFELKHGSIISLIGLPAGTKVMVTETNNAEDVYAVSAKYNGNARSLRNSDGTITGNSISIPKNDTAALEAACPIVLETDSDKIIITNTLRDISVTSVLFNAAPFMILAGAGILLVVLYFRNRRDRDSDSEL